ncbi:MAG: SurA N-terminal domain-containing protein [Bacteroidia bacterium]|nr:SurA N-terminal domain-containing protein [Bacteroidia bacterium]
MAKNKNEETGVILKIQKQTGCLLFVIGAAMLAFVLTDFFKSGSSMFGGSDNIVGEIAGEQVDYNELMDGVEGLKVLYQGSNLDEAQLRDQAWNQLIQEKVINTQFEVLGLETGTDELNDAMFGPNPDPIVVRNFTNPETNEFDPNVLKQFIEIDMQEDETKYANYLNFLEIPLKDSRSRTKWESLIKAGIYSTKLDARYEFDREERKMSAMAVGLPYTMIQDSTIKYEDSDLRSYLSENSDDYQQLATRDIDFVVLNVYPSAEDTLEAKEWIEDQTKRFSEVKPGNDSSFLANWRSLRQFNPTYVRRGASGFSPEVEDKLFASDTGEVTDVIYTQGIYGVYKVTGIKEDSVAVMRARHVLIPLGEDAEEIAKTTLADLKAGRTTFEIASKDNYDGTAASKGDLGWFTKEGSMVPKEVVDKVFASSEGSYFIVKSNRGHHVVNVTSGPFNKTIQIAALERGIIAGQEADRVVERKAAEIQFKAVDDENFDQVVEDLGHVVREATKITVSNPNVPGVPDAKEIARWLFNDKTRVGDVSEVITLPDRYVIAKCKAIREEGTASLEDIREQITADYVRDQIGNKLVEQMNEALASANDAEALAKALNTTTSLVPLVNMNSGQVAGVGAEPEIIGTILGLAQDKRSEPIKGVSGVYVVWNTGQVQAGEGPEFIEADFQTDITNRITQSAGETVIQALRKKANIVDKRYNFF